MRQHARSAFDERKQAPKGPIRPPIRPPTARLRQAWRAARDFQTEVQRALGSTAFIEWLLLETLQDLLDETRDAVNQAAIAQRAGLTKMVTSYWMAAMAEEGLVSRGPALDGRAYRIFIDELGELVLRECWERLEGAGLCDVLRESEGHSKVSPAHSR
jgi:hypothetical protein